MASFSIVIPTYNGAKYLKEAIVSALNQTRPADEVVVSDDNSSDETLEICEQFKDRIKVFRNENGPSGFVNGWNKAIERTTCDYISILHQDDKLSPTFLEEIDAAQKKYPNVRHFFVPCLYIDANGDVLDRSLNYCDGRTYRYSGQDYANAYERIKGHIHRCPGVVTHKSIFEVCQYREEAGHIADDDFFLRVGNYTDVVGVLKPLAYYREHSGSETGHLDFFKLNSRLLHDYHFQLEHASENPLLSNEIIELFKQWEAEYIHRLLIFGLKDREYYYVKEAIRYWFSFSKKEKFGNLKYDILSLKKKAKERLRSLHVRMLQKRAERLRGG